MDSTSFLSLQQKTSRKIRKADLDDVVEAAAAAVDGYENTTMTMMSTMGHSYKCPNKKGWGLFRTLLV